MVEAAEKVMRFIEDQFVVWGEHADWNLRYKQGAYWYSPAGLEQYKWYVPIDASTTVLSASVMYQMTGFSVQIPAVYSFCVNALWDRVCYRVRFLSRIRFGKNTPLNS